MIFSNLKLIKNKPIFIQIEEHIKKNIMNGTLLKDNKLPSTREVAEFLKVSRNSVITAYENLQSQGLISSKPGKGTFVEVELKIEKENFKIDWLKRENKYSKKCREFDIIKSLPKYEKGMISFKSIAPEEKLFDLEEFKRSFLNVWSLEGEKLLNYGYAQGYKPLIEYLKNYMKEKGVDIKNKDVLITNGFTEGFDLVLSSFSKPKDVIVCEKPTHNTALKIMKAKDLRIIGIEMDREGIIISRLKKVIQKFPVKFVYLIPSYHNPTGIVTSAQRRRDIYEILKDYQIPIIEDGFNEELIYSSSAVAPIASLASTGNGIIYIGSFSKILFPGLRIGWIFAEKSIIDSLESVKRARSIHSSFLDQGIMFNYLQSGSFNKYLKKVRKYYKEKYNFTLKLVKKYIPYEKISGEGGLHIYIELDKKICVKKLMQECYLNGVLIMPGYVFCDDDSQNNAFRIGFSRLKEEDIENGIKIISKIIKNMIIKP